MENNKKILIDSAKNCVDALMMNGVDKASIQSTVKSLYYNDFASSDLNYDNIVGTYIRRNVEDDAPTADFSALPQRIQLDVFVPEGEVAPNDEDILLENGYPAEAYMFFDKKAFVRKYNAEPGTMYRYYFRKVENNETDEEFIFKTVKKLLGDRPKMPKLKLAKTKKIGIVQICDVHYGAYCTKAEHGIEWGPQECEEDLHYIVTQAIEQIKTQGINKVIFSITGDGINSDTVTHTTAHGTPQNDAISYQQMFQNYLRIVVDLTNRIVNEANVPVNLVHTVGNHDELTGSHLISALKLYFDNNPNVEIFNEENFRKYRGFGNSLIMFSHGQQEGQRIRKAPYNDALPYCHGKKYMYAITEHTHQYAMIPDGRITQFTGATVAPPGTWTNQSAYTGGRRGGSLYIFDKEKGFMGLFNLYVKNEDIDPNIKIIE